MTDSVVYILRQDIPNEHRFSGSDYSGLLADFFCGIDVKFEPSDLFYQNGKPHLRNGFHLSVSKTIGKTFVGICKDQIGIDVECIDTLHLKDDHYNFLHRNEIRFSTNKRNFATIWTRKESLFKIIGTWYLNNSVLFDCSKDYIHFGSKYVFKNIDVADNLVITICTSNPETQIKVLDQIDLKC